MLLHGLMGSAGTWSAQVPWLTELGHVYTVAAPGHGRPGPRRPATEDFVADLATVTAPLSEPFVVVGHSMGALHGWVFAGQYPERVRALVVEDMAPDFTGRSAAGWAALIDAWPQPFADAHAVLEYFGPVFGNYFLRVLRRDADGYRLGGSRMLYQEIAEEWGRRDFWEQWRAVKAPALLLEAENSITGPGQMRAMAESHPLSRYVRVAGAGHLIHDEQPEKYQALVETFLLQVFRGSFPFAGQGETAVGGLFDESIDQQ